MSLEITFTIGKTDLILGESPVCTLRLKNTGQAPLVVPTPQGGSGMPAFRVLHVSTGVERLLRGNIRPAGQALSQELGQNESVETYIPLLDEISLPSVGEYVISAVYEYNAGKSVAESAPVRVKIRPMAVRNLFVDTVQGAVVQGVWVNPAGDPPDIVAGRFDILPGGGVESIEAIGKGTLLSRPIISMPPNNTPSAGRWIAWIDKAALAFVHRHQMGGASRPGKFKLSTANVEIVPPVYNEPNKKTKVRGGGAALIWLEKEGGQSSALQIISLLADGDRVKAKAGAMIDLPGPRPKWMMQHVRSDSTRLVTFINASGDHLSLNSTTWPDQALTTRQARKLKDWEGEFLAAGATMGLDDVIRGALLIWVGSDPTRKLEMLRWSIDAKGTLSEEQREAIPWPATVPVGPATVRVRVTGIPAALLRAHGRDWSVYDGFGHLMPVPAPYQQTNLQIDFAFFGGQEVVLICAELTGGLSVKRMDGSDLPPVRE